MGLPVVVAPCEAEAQCAELTKTGKAFATATEDADALTFGSTVLLRNLSFSGNAQAKTTVGGSSATSSANTVMAIKLDVALSELQLTMDEFVDLCILCGCDYCGTIRGIGPKKAYTLIKQHRTLERVIENLDATTHPIPDPFPFEQAREFFKNPEVIPGNNVNLKWAEPDFEGFKKFLVDENQFTEQRVDNYIQRLKKSKQKFNQRRLDSFFVRKPPKAPTPPTTTAVTAAEKASPAPAPAGEKPTAAPSPQGAAADKGGKGGKRGRRLSGAAGDGGGYSKLKKVKVAAEAPPNAAKQEITKPDLSPTPGAPAASTTEEKNEPAVAPKGSETEAKAGDTKLEQHHAGDASYTPDA
eukprot:GHVT01032809.1.p1 GENE.GHVT01032809.1~~GHVT01032809.1.p1  ORF type:complete len:355 (+),score=84.92 GHVT01032809.1:218-1282(+)